MEKGPGPQLRASSPEGGRKPSTTCLGSPSQGFSSMVRHTIIVMRPPGLSAVRMFRRPCAGLEKNLVPKRETTKSWSGVNAWDWESPSMKVTLLEPAAALGCC